MLGYRQDLRRAWRRINHAPARKIETSRGTVEFAVCGDGLPMLVSHGVLGSHADAVDSYWSSLVGDGYRIVAPARFGYFGSTLPGEATPADQADVYAELLDRLGIDQVLAIGFSAGSGSILEFARRHRERTSALVLACCRLGGGVTLGAAWRPVLRFVYGSDPLFWAFKTIAPAAFSRMMGVPKNLHLATEQQATLAETRELLFPVRPRRDGAIFDGFVSNVTADQFRFEDLRVPTLVISARDDPLAPYRFAVEAARRIPNAELLTFDDGGHLFLGRAEEVRAAIRDFAQVPA